MTFKVYSHGAHIATIHNVSRQQLRAFWPNAVINLLDGTVTL